MKRSTELLIFFPLDFTDEKIELMWVIRAAKCQQVPGTALKTTYYVLESSHPPYGRDPMIN